MKHAAISVDTSANAPVQAALMVTLGMALMGLVDNLVIEIAQLSGLWQFHFIRAVIALPLVAVIAVITGWTWRPVRFNAVALRSLWITMAMLCYFGSLGFLSVAEAVAGVFTAPFFVLLITRFWYRERVRRLNVIAALCGFAGSLLVLRPDVGAADWTLGLPVIGGVFYALTGLSTRRSCAGESALSMLLGFIVAIGCMSAVGLLATTLSALEVPAGADGFLLRGWVPMTGYYLLLVLAQALTVIIGFGLITRSYMIAEAATVSVFEYVLLIFAAFWGWILWAETLDRWDWIGVTLIFLSGLALAGQGRRT